jgi:hypothetical protein
MRRIGELFGLISDYTIGTAIVLAHLFVVSRARGA